jgi:hypothetical protein
MSDKAAAAWLQGLFDAADLRHHRRRRRTARIYKTVDLFFFGSLFVLAILLFARFATVILPLYVP